MAVLAWPAGIPSPTGTDTGFQFRSRLGVLTSPLTGTEVTQELPGARWLYTPAWEVLDSTEWKLLQGLVAALSDTTNTVAIADPAYAMLGRQGGLTGTPTATGNAFAKVVSLAGVAGADPVLRMGDRIQLGTRLYIVTGDVTKSGTTATVPIQPPLRAAFANTAIAYVNPTGEFRLLDGDQGAMRLQPPATASFRPAFIEPLP
jgi:hypothetical protein